MNDSRGRQVRSASDVWALTMLAVTVYWTTLRRFPPTPDDLWFVAWSGVVALGTALISAWAMSRPRSWHRILGLAASPAVGFATAYVAALFTYGSGGEDGTMWRGIGGGLIGVISSIVAALLFPAHRRSSRARLRASQA